MTAAPHSFAHGDNVFCPLAGRQEIGKSWQVIMAITHTDVAIVELHEGLEFVNETFKNTTVGGLCSFGNLARASETLMGTEVYMDNRLRDKMPKEPVVSARSCGV